LALIGTVDQSSYNHQQYHAIYSDLPINAGFAG
jgi:hypothetical protein